MRFFISIIFLSLSVFPLQLLGAELNAGFVQGMWFAREPVAAEKQNRIYVAFRNSTEHDLTGTVRFTDNSLRLGTTDIRALPGRLVEAWIDFTPRYGDHKIVATLSDVTVHAVGSLAENASPSDTVVELTFFADHDTDADGLLNETDEDDDGDGVTDLEEQVQKSDPLVPNVSTQKQTQNASTTDTTLTQNSINTEATLHGIAQFTPVSLRGLETKLPEGTVQNVVEKVTETIESTKNSLDSYRVHRKNMLDAHSKSESVEEVVTENGATITRSQAPKDESFWDTIIDGGLALVSLIYSAALWLISHALAYAAAVELFILFFILYVFYRIARMFGGRSQN